MLCRIEALATAASTLAIQTSCFSRSYRFAVWVKKIHNSDMKKDNNMAAVTIHEPFISNTRFATGFAMLHKASANFSLRSKRHHRRFRFAEYGFAEILASLNMALPEFSLGSIRLRRSFCFVQHSFAQHGCAEVLASLNMVFFPT